MSVGDCAKELNRLGPQNTGAGGWRTMGHWRRNWGRRVENNGALEMELEPGDGE